MHKKSLAEHLPLQPVIRPRLLTTKQASNMPPKEFQDCYVKEDNDQPHLLVSCLKNLTGVAISQPSHTHTACSLSYFYTFVLFAQILATVLRCCTCPAILLCSSPTAIQFDTQSAPREGLSPWYLRSRDCMTEQWISRSDTDFADINRGFTRILWGQLRRGNAT